MSLAVVCAGCVVGSIPHSKLHCQGAKCAKKTGVCVAVSAFAFHPFLDYHKSVSPTPKHLRREPCLKPLTSTLP